MTRNEKIDAIAKKWATKAFDDGMPIDDAMAGAIKETIAECAAIADSMRGSGETDLRSVRSRVGGFTRWGEDDE